MSDMDDYDDWRVSAQYKRSRFPSESEDHDHWRRTAGLRNESAAAVVQKEEIDITNVCVEFKYMSWTCVFVDAKLPRYSQTISATFVASDLKDRVEAAFRDFKGADALQRYDLVFQMDTEAYLLRDIANYELLIKELKFKPYTSLGMMFCVHCLQK